MKKIIFLLLFTVSFYGQTYQNPTYGTVTEKTNTTDNTPAYFVTSQTDGVHKKTPAALIEKTANKSDSYTASSSTTYASTKALVDGLGTKSTITTIAQIRAFTGALSSNNFYTTDLGKEGDWHYDSTDTTSADNTGTILVTSDGKRIKRTEASIIKPEWFGANSNGVTNNTSVFSTIISYLSNVGGGTILFEKGVFDFALSSLTLPENVTLDFQGGSLSNVFVYGDNSNITGNCQIPASNIVFLLGTFKPNNTVYNYETMQDCKNFVHWQNKICKTEGMFFKNDGGAATYRADLNSVLSAENPYFTPYWASTNLAGGYGLYVVVNGQLSLKLIPNATEVNLAVFGLKFDANYFYPTDKKYYTDSSHTVLATDNHDALVAALNQLHFWSENEIPKTLILSKTLILNSTLYLSHGAYDFKLKGQGYADASVISSNVSLDALIENYYDGGANINNLTGTTYVIEDISFRGYGRVADGLIVKSGYEADGLNRLEFHDFTNAGVVFYGVSSTFKADTFSCFNNKYGVLITSTHPYRLTNNTQDVDGLISLYKISGDHNTDALIAIDCTSVGSSINIQSVKSENNNNATILIKRSTEQQYIGVKNAFANGDGDFIKIENYPTAKLPTIEIVGIFQNDPDNDNYDINDLKNSKQIRFAKNPTGAFPHVIYTNGENYEKGFLLYENGNLTDFAKIDSPIFTGTPTAPTAAAGTNTTQIATTAFVQNAVTSGTYTPTLTPSNTTIVGGTTYASYTKNGNIVHVTVSFQVTPTINQVPTITVTLPFNRANTANINAGGSSIWDSSTSSVIGGQFYVNNTSSGVLRYRTGAGINIQDISLNFTYDISR